MSKFKKVQKIDEHDNWNNTSYRVLLPVSATLNAALM